MFKIIKSILVMMIIDAVALTCTSCRTGSGTSAETDDLSIEDMTVRPVHVELPGVYYWKTVFAPDSAQIALLARHDVGRMYLRMFDVSADKENIAHEERVVPNATVRIDHDRFEIMKDKLPEMEYVPVVYITLDALREVSGDEGSLARRIVERVRNMCSYNEIPDVAELQLDCDWTVSTEQSFFALCDSVKAGIASMDLPWRLSSTIRLHQLAREAPPVDCGVLMVYNTGNFDDPDARNSIIDPEDVAPYLKYLSKYPLHLDVAYPTYSWQLLFHERRFSGLLNGVDTSDTTRFIPGRPGCHVAIRDIPFRRMIIRRGDVIRTECSGYDDIAAVKDAIERKLNPLDHSNILYHLDPDNLSDYTTDEINHILCPSSVR